MSKTKIFTAVVIILLLGFCSGKKESETEEQDAPVLSAKEQLGKMIFFDTNLSDPPGQSCATCHGPAVGFSGPDSEINITTVVYPGALSPRFGNRRPPTAAYAGASPKLHRDEEGNGKV